MLEVQYIVAMVGALLLLEGFFSGSELGLASLSKNGLRYPIPPWGVQADPSPSLAVSYPGRKF